MSSGLLAVLLAAVAGWLGSGRASAAARRLSPRAPAGAFATAGSAIGRHLTEPVLRRAPALVGVLVAALTVLGLGLLAVVVAAGAAVLLIPSRRAERAASRRAGDIARDLPLVADLLATCLHAGAAPATALSLVCNAVTGPLCSELRPVSAALRLGVDPSVAWCTAARSGGPVAGLARAFIRASATGAPLAATVSAVADDARERARWDAEASARRAGVRAVGPLAVCFLPAFLLLGVVPIVASVAGQVLAGLD